MWFVPTRGRPHRLQKFLDGCVATGMTMPGLIVVDGADGGDYSKVRLPSNWMLEVAPERGEAGGRMEAYFKEHPGEAFYSIVNDDVVPETPGWDVELARSAGDWNVAYPWDMLSEIATQFVVGGELCRAVGSFSLGFEHSRVDIAWMDIGAAIGRLVFRKDLRLRHEHFANKLAPRDETYGRMWNGHNVVAFDRWRYFGWRREEFFPLLDKLRGLVDPLPFGTSGLCLDHVIEVLPEGAGDIRHA